ncbi:O-antigen ligase family protein [Hyphobacterium sp. CCMP332]|nr:O-antigen ligase family protein [Hyphobacterium sp. CCMP332]
MVQTPFRKIEGYIDKGYLLSLFVIALTLPISPFFLQNILSYSTILFLIFSLGKIFINKDFSLKENKISLTLFSSIFLWWAFGILYSENINSAFRLLETKLGLLLIPFFILTISPLSKKNFKSLLKAYALGITVYMLFSYLMVFIQNYQYNEFKQIVFPFYMYHSLVHFIGMHATYMAIQVAMAIIIVLDISIDNKFKKLSVNILNLLWISFLIFVLFSLTVKMIILAFLLSLIVFIFVRIGFNRALKIILPLLLIGLVSVWVLSDHKRFKERLGLNEKISIEHYGMDPENNKGKWGSLNMRIALAKINLEVIKKNPVFGVGIGDEKDARLNAYMAYDFKFGINHGFNEHNQYLNLLLSAGMVGLFIFIIVIAYPVVLAFKSKDAIYLAYLSLIIMSFLTENYLSRQIGVMFFAFFHSLFWQQLSYANKTIQSNSV